MNAKIASDDDGWFDVKNNKRNEDITFAWKYARAYGQKPKSEFNL